MKCGSRFHTLSCNVSISSLRSCFCSGVSLAIHASLSNLTGSVSAAVGDEDGWDGFVEEVDGFVLGWPKKEVMELLAFGFLADSAARSAALRLSDIFGMCGFGRSLTELSMETTRDGPRDALIGRRCVSRSGRWRGRGQVRGAVQCGVVQTS